MRSIPFMSFLVSIFARNVPLVSLIFLKRLLFFQWLVISDPFDFNLFMLCPWVMSFFQKLCPAPFPPVSCSFPEPTLGPQCGLYNLLEGQPENSWPLGDKCCIISNPSRYPGLYLPCFLQHEQQQHFPVDLLGWVTGTQCLLMSIVASVQGQLGFQGQCLPLWELALKAIWGQTVTTLLLKLQIYPWSNLHSTCMKHLVCCLLLIFP